MQMAQVGANVAAYQSWLSALDAALKNNSRGFDTSSIDGALAYAAFQAGASPVVYARNVQPKPASFYPQTSMPMYGQVGVSPSVDIIRWTYRFLSMAGWAFWVIGGVAALIAAVILLLAMFSGNSFAASVGVMAGLFNVFVAFCIFVAGSLWHYLAQRLALAYVDSRAAHVP